MKNDSNKIGPLDIFKVGPKKYFNEFIIQLKVSMTRPPKIRSRHQIFKEDIGHWPLFFSLIICFVIMAFCILAAEIGWREY